MDTEILTMTSISRQWWRSKRPKYNKVIFISEFVAFLLYGILDPIISAPHEEFEEKIFEMVFQGLAYLIIAGIINSFYPLGWIIDISFNNKNSQRFRERLFALGYWFSFALPILLIISVMVRFLIWGH